MMAVAFSCCSHVSNTVVVNIEQDADQLKRDLTDRPCLAERTESRMSEDGTLQKRVPVHPRISGKTWRAQQ